MKTIKKLNLLTACVFLAQQTYALELLKENEMSGVTGQDGLVITHEVSKVEVDQLNWYDPNTYENSKMGLGLHGVEILGKDFNNITSTFELDVGTTTKSDNTSGAGIRFAAKIDPFSLNANLKLISKEDCTASSNCAPSNPDLGRISAQLNSPFKIVLETTAGLFNKNETATIDFNLQDVRLKHTLSGNSLVLDNFNFKFSGTGYMYIDPKEGIVLESTKDQIINLAPVLVGNEEAKTAGVNFDIRYQTGSGELKNIMRYGISGAVSNARLALSANQSTTTIARHQTAINNFDITNKTDGNFASELKETAEGYDQSSGGLHLNLSADFINEDVTESLKATTLEIGHTGKGSYAVQFQNLRSLTGINPAYIDFGDIYINTLRANNIEFLINSKIQKVLGYGSDKVQQQLINDIDTPDSGNNVVLVAIRRLDFQSLAGKANFISNDTGLVSDNSGSWGIGIPIYNLNANIVLAGTDVDDKQALAYNVMASTDGYGIDKVTNSPSTTSLLIIDGNNNYYAGLRNIDTFFESNGTISYDDRGIRIIANKLVFAADAEIAIGKLPNIGDPDSDFNFTDRQDVLTNLAFKLDGSGNLLIIPGVDDSNDPLDGTNFLSFEADFVFRPLSDTPISERNLGSYFSLSNIDGDGVNNEVSSIMIKEMQGHLGLASKIQVEKDTVVLDNQIKFNHTDKLNNVFRANLAMQTNGNIQNMAHLAITGGTMRSTLGIKPR